MDRETSTSPPPLEDVNLTDTECDAGARRREAPAIYPGRIELSQDTWTSGATLQSFRCTLLHVSGGISGHMVTVRTVISSRRRRRSHHEPMREETILLLTFVAFLS